MFTEKQRAAARRNLAKARRALSNAARPVLSATVVGAMTARSGAKDLLAKGYKAKSATAQLALRKLTLAGVSLGYNFGKADKTKPPNPRDPLATSSLKFQKRLAALKNLPNR